MRGAERVPRQMDSPQTMDSVTRYAVFSLDTPAARVSTEGYPYPPPPGQGRSVLTR